MKLLIAIFGFFGVFGVLVLLALLVVGWRLYRFVQGVKKGLEGWRAEGAVPPAEVTLSAASPMESWDEEHEDEARRATEELVAAGFVSLGRMKAEEMPDLLLEAFVHEADRIYGVVYEMEPVGIWADLVVMRDDASLTVTNTAQGDGLDERPGHRKVRLPGASVAQAIAHLRSLTSPAEWRAVDASTFRADFERAYREHMAWIRSRGGPTDEEVRAVAARSGLEATPEGIAAVRSAWSSAEEARPEA